MASSWSFKKITPAPPASSIQIPIASRSNDLTNSLHLLDVEPARYAMAYGRLHLLGLPSEVRDELWQTVFDDITVSLDRADPVTRPLTDYFGLCLTCHQIYDEVAFFWPRNIIQHNRITTFVEPNIANLRDFKRLTLEVPLTETSGFFRAAAATLKSLAPALQDLKLFFVGSDKFQVFLRLDSGRLYGANPQVISQRLTIDGQRHSDRQALFVALCKLSNLRVLVLSNHNFPLLSCFVLGHKPHLKHLHLLTDSRTTVHKCLDLGVGGLTPLMIKPPQHSFPPVQTLSISANASLNSLQIAGACTINLKHLTWTVPDLSLQSAGGVRVNWYRDTTHLLRLLKNNSKKLRTLRICIEEAIYEADTAAGILMPGFHMFLEHLPIEIFELHVNSQSPWFGRELLQCLPNSLRRLYFTRELLDERNLLEDADDRYLACYSSGAQKPYSTFLSKYLHGFDGDDFTLIGEEGNRDDFISMSGGRLGFIGYEYDPTKSTRFGNSQTRNAKAEDTRAAMLMLNGRLLDRERNMHLKKFDGAKRIPPSQSAQHYKGSMNNHSIAEKYGAMWVYAPPNMRETKAARKELEESVIVENSNYYFGNEAEAAEVFQAEPCVEPDNVLERLWPDEVPARKGDHWMTDHRIEEYDPREHHGINCRRRRNHDTKNHSWGDERVAQWVQNWTWYNPQTKYLDDPENFLTQRAGQSLESLKFAKEER